MVKRFEDLTLQDDFMFCKVKIYLYTMEQKKVIINAEAFNDTKNKELKEFLEYFKTGKAKSKFTRRIDAMIQTIKNNEQARQEYRLMSTFEMDAMDRGAYKTKRETAILMKQRGYPTSEILLMTGLPESEIEKL